MRPRHRRPGALGAATLATGLALAAAACGGGGGFSSGGDTTRGEQLFKQKCGTCHTLAAAGTRGTIGPNLDNAFASDRKQGFAQISIQQVIADQIRHPISTTPTGEPGMPANLVSGADIDNVAAYVASVAGNPGAVAKGGGGVSATSGKGVFLSAGCTSCHTLKDAGSKGTIGPNLDERRPSKSRVVDRVTNGRGVMPSFKGTLTAKQIQAVADYVSSVAGK